MGSKESRVRVDTEDKERLEKSGYSARIALKEWLDQKLGNPNMGFLPGVRVKKISEVNIDVSGIIAAINDNKAEITALKALLDEDTDDDSIEPSQKLLIALTLPYDYNETTSKWVRRSRTTNVPPSFDLSHLGSTAITATSSLGGLGTGIAMALGGASGSILGVLTDGATISGGGSPTVVKNASTGKAMFVFGVDNNKSLLIHPSFRDNIAGTYKNSSGSPTVESGTYLAQDVAIRGHDAANSAQPVDVRNLASDGLTTTLFGLLVKSETLEYNPVDSDFDRIRHQWKFSENKTSAGAGTTRVISTTIMTNWSITIEDIDNTSTIDVDIEAKPSNATNWYIQANITTLDSQTSVTINPNDEIRFNINTLAGASVGVKIIMQSSAR